MQINVTLMSIVQDCEVMSFSTLHSGIDIPTYKNVKAYEYFIKILNTVEIFSYCRIQHSTAYKTDRFVLNPLQCSIRIITID